MKKSWTKQSHKVLEQATSLGFYNKWIISLFRHEFGDNLLEIGSGLGGISRYLSGEQITLSDSRSDYCRYLQSCFKYPVIKLNIEKEAPQSLLNLFSTIISSNVFEHIKNDKSAFNNSFDLLKKNGRLLLFVPARPEIYGSLDKSMGHYRRYTKEELAHKAKAAGFKIIKIKYINFPGYFSWWFRGKLPVKSGSDNLLAKIFDYLIVPFLYPEKYLPIPFGQSLMLVAQKT
jgi:2-polyprenyl-3-methyl-5-hydroxy-6-metoxy-1,4-benzoquinol methylase